MRHDIFEWRSLEMTWWDKLWRVMLLITCVAVLVLDIFIWRP